jgi:hypothetical protein
VGTYTNLISMGISG